MKRRAFIRGSLLAGSGLMIPGFLKALQKPNPQFNGKRLIVVQLSGGNDGLNTVVPYTNDLYYQLRPTIALPKTKLHHLSDELALHPSMPNFHSLYHNGELNIINHVGYPNQNKSHFRATDIWLSASDANENRQYGWLGQYMDAECELPHSAIQSGNQLSSALKGSKGLGMAFSDPQQLYRISNESYLKGLSRFANQQNSQVRYLYQTLKRTQDSSADIYRKYKHISSPINYPNTQFAHSLKMIASLIGADIQTKIYYTELGGFDTHSNQLGRQANLLKQLDEGLWALRQDLKSKNQWCNTLVLIFSEFGRRINENGSKGTDHGKANNVFLLGGQLKKPGVVNDASDLLHAEGNDLLHHLDFRRIYADILQNWLQTNSTNILNKHFRPMNLI